MPLCIGCDVCDKHATMPGRHPPAGWLIVISDATRTYCSKACYDTDEQRRAWRAQGHVSR